MPFKYIRKDGTEYSQFNLYLPADLKRQVEEKCWELSNEAKEKITPQSLLISYLEHFTKE